MSSNHFPLHRPELHDLLIQGETAIRASMGPPMGGRKGDVLINTGEERGTVSLLESGWIARPRAIEDGRRQIIVVFLHGDLMGIKPMLMERQPDTIESLTDVHVRNNNQRRLLDLVARNHAAT